MAERADVTFPSEGLDLAAWLYRPQGAEGDVPLVVMAHGFSCTREDGLPSYADAFADAGLAVLLFDYRHFGDSPGSPRQLIDIGRQRDDYRAAIAYVRGLDGIDPERIALWGSSFSGGHALALAGEDPRIAAVVAQAPFVDGLATTRAMEPSAAAKATAHALLDQLGAWVGRPPHEIAVCGPPGSVAALTVPEAEPGFALVVPAHSRWENRFAPRVLLTLALQRPAAVAPRLAMPVHVVVCDRDTITPPEPAARVAERAPRGELLRRPSGHFEIYADEVARAAQVSFLRRALLPSAVPAVAVA